MITGKDDLHQFERFGPNCHNSNCTDFLTPKINFVYFQEEFKNGILFKTSI